MKFQTIICSLVLLAQAKAYDVKPIHPTIHAPDNIRFFASLHKNRIVNGVEATPHEHPYQVGLFLELPTGIGFCGGSLISPSFVLTAAHCAPSTALSVEVVLGAHKVWENEESQVRIKSTEFIVHENYSAGKVLYDIALIRLPIPVELTDYINVIGLGTYSDQDETFVDQLATLTGWGKTADGDDSISDTLLRANFKIIENRICNLYFFGAIKDSHICSDGYKGQTPCNGDSGGPLVVDGVQVGIVSFGIGFGCDFLWPGAYTRVTSYLDWIEAHSDVAIKQ